MTEPAKSPFKFRRLWWLMALKIVLLALAIYLTLRAYNLV